jgi:hypothetical protein
VGNPYAGPPYQGPPPYSGPTPPEPGLWLGLSIAATLLCCTPIGVVGIVYSALAMEARTRGDLYGWESRVRSARTWTLWSVGLGALLVVAVIVLFVTNPELAES